MFRREFLALPAAVGLPAAAPNPLPALAEQIFFTILRGYLTHTSKTSNSLAVVEYPEATITKTFLSKSGLSASGVTRMLPAIAAWIASGRRPAVLELDKQKFDLLDVAGSAIVNGTNPDHKDYWLPCPPNEQNQRQVESSVVAWSVYLLRDTLLPQMASHEREKIDRWLRSCTERPVRGNNWAWFTAVNIAARMALKDKFDEFSFDQKFMFEDLTALDGMYVGEGWYNDAKPGHAFDYYNSWVFASHFLYWNAMVGPRYPEWSARFGDRLRQYLETAPLFFGAGGGHILYGRSLIYRWGVLTPLVLAYLQKLWPHPTETLQRIVYGNLDFHWRNGAYSAADNKLRETFSRQGTRDIRETYIDGGHVYWGMQAFSMWLIPASDPFWTGARGTLPVEQSNFVKPIGAAGLLLSGNRESGQVKLLQAKSSKTDLHYRDKYNKFSYSSHFAPCLMHRPDVCPWDSALVLRDRRRRRSAGRGAVDEGRLLADGIELAYPIAYGALKVNVRTTILGDGEFEARLHRVIVPEETDPGMDIAEGSFAFGYESPDEVDQTASESTSMVRHKRTGELVASWMGPGWTGIGAAWDFGTEDSVGSNVIYPRFFVNTLWAPLKPGALILYSVHYASPKPLPTEGLTAKANSLLLRLRGLVSGTAPAKPVSPPSSGAKSKTAPAKARP